MTSAALSVSVVWVLGWSLLYFFVYFALDHELGSRTLFTASSNAAIGMVFVDILLYAAHAPKLEFAAGIIFTGILCFLVHKNIHRRFCR